MSVPGAATGAGTGPGGGRERLDRTRLAILDYLQRTRHGEPAPGDASTQAPPRARPPRWAGLREAGRRHWEGHPARLVLRLALPVLAHLGRRHPLALVAVAAGAGALLVMARPWKLVSLTGLAVAALKSPRLASLALSALASMRTHRPGPESPRP